MPRITQIILAVLACLVLTNAPARAEKNLKRPPGTTRYAPMVAQLKALLEYDKTQGERRMQLSSLGRSVKGRTIWMVTLHEPETPAAPSEDGQPPVTLPAPKKLLYLCRQHGHEPASTEGALAFVHDLVYAPADSPLADDLRRVTVSVVPMANPDGAEAFLRHNAHNVDLNRDWLRRTQPETQAWWQAIQSIRPDMMTDQHELYPDDSRGDFTETAGDGCGARPDVITTCEGTAATVRTSMTAAGFPITCHWITDHHPARLAHRYGCVVAGVPTVLFETNRQPEKRRDVAARGRAQYQFMVTVLRDLAGERQDLLAEAAARTGADRATLLASRHKEYVREAAPAASSPTPPGLGTNGAGAQTKDGE